MPLAAYWCSKSYLSTQRFIYRSLYITTSCNILLFVMIAGSLCLYLYLTKSSKCTQCTCGFSSSLPDTGIFTTVHQRASISDCCSCFSYRISEKDGRCNVKCRTKRISSICYSEKKTFYSDVPTPGIFVALEETIPATHSILSSSNPIQQPAASFRVARRLSECYFTMQSNSNSGSNSSSVTNHSIQIEALFVDFTEKTSHFVT